MEYNINNGYSTCYTSLQSQLPTPPGSDSAYSPENGTIPCSSSCYYSPDTGLDALTYTQCMQQASQSTEASVPVTTIHHHQRADQQPPPPPPQVPHHTNLSPIHHHQVSPQQQVSPDSSTGNVVTTTPNMTSNLTPPTQLNTFLMRMQQAGQCAEQHQRLLLQHEQETARRLSHIGNMYSTALPNLEISRMPKKRKMTTASPNHNIKTEPGKEYEIEDNTPETYRSLPWSDYDKDKWAVMLDTNGRLIGGFKYVVSADKGFVHSEAHAAFVSQKKNHFQVTVTAYGFGAPKFIRTENGLAEIRSFCITLFGFKNESKSQVIAINQSTVERQKYSLDPIRVEFHNGSLTKTIPRLHFSATTENNMRKKGKPNPNQRFFSLVVSLEAETVAGTKHCVAAAISDRIIVRASSPSNFDLEQQLWERVDNSSIRYMGNVGINIDRPEHATLAVGGNVVITGAINNYSDKRVKENISAADTNNELKAVKKLNLYKYNYTDEFCDYSNIETDEQMGVIAQEVQNIFPDAVRTNGEVNLPSSGKIDNLLTVNKDRIYMAGVGAVKELSGITDNILEKIDELEQVNTNLVDRFKRRFGSKSTLNSSIKSGFKSKEKTHFFGSMESLRSRMSIKKTLRMMQGAVCCLSAVVVLCLAAIICLFVVMHHNARIVSYHHGDPSDTPTIPDIPNNNSTNGSGDHDKEGDDGGKASPQQAVTVIQNVTYGPTQYTPTKEPTSTFFQNVKCDIAKIQNIDSTHYKLQYMRSGKRLNCIYQLNMTPEEYYLLTNDHYFKILISTTQDRIDMEHCQYKPTPCDNIFLNTNATISNKIANPAAKVQSKQRAHDREYEYLLLSQTSKIVSRVRLLPANAACSQCCHVNNGDFTDIRFTFNFKCPTPDTKYRIHPIT